ncbi:hypothetical protein DV737_g4693, partial [Chaetothyriales sp. CBS 132003]
MPSDSGVDSDFDPSNETTVLLPQDAAHSPPVERRFLGIPADLCSMACYCEGTFFTAGYTKIGSIFKEQHNAVWLKLVSSITTSVAYPMASGSHSNRLSSSLIPAQYSHIAMSDSWEWLLTSCYLIFAGGLFLSALSPSFFTLLMARLLTSVGTAGMVYIPNLVFNGTYRNLSALLGSSNAT